jgi:hypothetical protein
VEIPDEDRDSGNSRLILIAPIHWRSHGASRFQRLQWKRFLCKFRKFIRRLLDQPQLDRAFSLNQRQFDGSCNRPQPANPAR